METMDNVIHIHHEADWSSTAVVSWHNPTSGQIEVGLEAQRLWDERCGSDVAIDLPPHICVRAVRLATRGRAQWEHDHVLSRPVPGRRILTWVDEQSKPEQHHDPTDGWLFDSNLATRASNGHRVPKRDIPLGWVENVAIAMQANGHNFQLIGSTAVLVDIGAPHREPCTCGKAFHDRSCPQSDVFPRIGRLAINLARVDAFIETMQRARTSVERIFVPEVAR